VRNTSTYLGILIAFSASMVQVNNLLAPADLTLVLPN
jgi:hypothetical protein